ncbi:hypothetical protein CBER1_02870 [Cercospora berteroae]|uniref:Uncharacterized protein n=1 Tax=Cercospora berteroae TaxID=357750 RepID=A0A2S6BQG6_9PEZI|nr:hypothetical protein CBER1_02870 [Cercospora berteroae]
MTKRTARKRDREANSADAGASPKRARHDKSDRKVNYPSFYTTVRIFLTAGMAKITKCCLDSGYQSRGQQAHINPSVVRKMGLKPYKTHRSYTLADGSRAINEDAIDLPLTFETPNSTVTVDTTLFVNSQDVDGYSILVGTGILHTLGAMQDHQPNPSKCFITIPNSGTREELVSDPPSSKATATWLPKPHYTYHLELSSISALATSGCQALPSVAWTQLGTSRELHAKVSYIQERGLLDSSKMEKLDRVIQMVAEQERREFWRLAKINEDEDRKSLNQKVDNQFSLPDANYKLRYTYEVSASDSSGMAYIKQEPVDDFDDYDDSRSLQRYREPVDSGSPYRPVRIKQQIIGLSAQAPHYTANREPFPFKERHERISQRALGQPAQSLPSYTADRGGELSERSRQVGQAKRYGNYPDGIFGNVFETTGMIVGSTTCLRVTHMMIDTGASSIIISAAAAEQANLTIIACDPQTFTLADGSQITYNHLAHFELYISGIHNKVVAFIDQGNSGHHILLGKPGIKTFNATANFSYGRMKETRWFMAQDETGLRGRKILLHEDPASVAPILISYGRYEGLKLAMRLGETATQRNSREVLERADKKRDKLYKKHEKNVLRRRDVRDFPDLFGRQSE